MTSVGKVKSRRNREKFQALPNGLRLQSVRAGWSVSCRYICILKVGSVPN